MNIPTQIIRTLRTDPSSVDYLIGALLVILLLPKFKKALFEEPES